MNVHKITIENFLCFLLPITIGSTFPFQVLSGNKFAGGISSIVLVLLFFIFFLRTGEGFARLYHRLSLNKWDWLVSAFVLLCAVNAIVAFSVGSRDVLAEFYLTFQAITVYVFFSRIAKNQEVKSFLYGVLFFATLSGAFYAYETILKLGLNTIMDYSVLAYEYSLNSLNQARDGSNTFRIKPSARSFGVLEKHTTSALWLVFGVYTASILSKRDFLRIFYLGLGLSVLMVVQNFSALVVFVTVSLISYRLKTISQVFFIFLFFSYVGLVTCNYFGIHNFTHNILQIMSIQIKTIFTMQIERSGNSYISLIISELTRAWVEVNRNPLQLLFGFGVGDNAHYDTSGDVGFIESVLRLGLPLWFFLSMTFLLHALKIFRHREFLKMNAEDKFDKKMLFFSAQLLLSIWAMDVHYSAWIHKSVWPILFFAMALARRPSSQRVHGVLSN